MIWDNLAKKYDHIWVQKHSLSPTRREVIKRVARYQPSTLLDAGCGTGQLIEEAKKVCPELIAAGFDKSPAMIGEAKKKGICDDFFVGEICGDESLPVEGTVYDMITCTHSFPYYPHKPLALERLCRLAHQETIFVFVQASINSPYDKMVMYLIEKTAEKADYLSKQAFLELTEKHLELIETFSVKDTWYMPSICGFVMKKRA